MRSREMQSVFRSQREYWGRTQCQEGYRGTRLLPHPNPGHGEPWGARLKVNQAGGLTHLHFQEGKGVRGERWGGSLQHCLLKERGPIGSFLLTGPGSASLGWLLQVHMGKTGDSVGPKPQRPPVREGEEIHKSKHLINLKSIGDRNITCRCKVHASPKSLVPAPGPLSPEDPPGAHAPHPSPPSNQSLPCA